MKRLIISGLLLLMFALGAKAQNNMNIAKIFDGNYKKMKDVTQVNIKGGCELERYSLTLYRAFTVENNPSLAAEIEKLVVADGKKAIAKETKIKGGKLYYAVYTFEGDKGTKKYMFYRNSKSKSDPKSTTVTVVYMEGTASMEKLKRMFN